MVEKNIFNAKALEKKFNKNTTCTFCLKKEKPAIHKHGFRLLYALFSYVPAHAILVPLDHYTSLSKLEKQEFSRLGKIFGKVLQPGVHAFSNDGKTAAQSEDHLHIHIVSMPIDSPAKLVKRGAEYKDPLSKTISEKVEVKSHFFEGFHQKGGLNFIYPSTEEFVKSGLTDLRKARKSLANALDKMRKNLAMLSKKEKRIMKKAGDFGANYLFKKLPDGRIKMTVIPRAIKSRVAGLELAMNIKPIRVNKSISAREVERRDKFYNFLIEKLQET